MKIEHLDYFMDVEGIIYQKYGWIQPKNKILCQISYVPIRLVKNPPKKLKQKTLFNETYIKWTPYVDLVGVEEYVRISKKELPKHISFSKLNNQIAEIDFKDVIKVLPLTKFNTTKLHQTIKKLVTRIAKEVEIPLSNINFSCLSKYEKYDFLEKGINQETKNAKTDLDLYIRGKQESLKTRNYLQKIRENEPQRCNIIRGNTGEKIPHRISYDCEGYSLSVDFLLSPKENEIPEIARTISENYEDIKIENINNNIEITIINDEEGYSFPQQFICDEKQIISLAHRYDFHRVGNVNIKNTQVVNIPNTTIKFILINKYGTLNSTQTEALKS